MSGGLQEAIATLTRFWTDHGCLALPSCDIPVPAAIVNPGVFFRLLDSEPWSAAYLQPVRRPLDGRFGRHPFRLARHLQFEVVIQDEKADVRQLYLESLRELGADLAVHDLRFAERDWTALSIGARGLGWHVLLDGIGITRFTFLQEWAGRPLDPGAVEITYGLERLSMAVERVGNAFSLRWSEDGPSLGELYRGVEGEFSRYALETADVALLEEELTTLEGASRRALDGSLLRLAYESAVRMLQPIDVLYLRGALSARERRGCLGRVRELILAIADAHSPLAPGAESMDQPAAGSQPAEPEPGGGTEGDGEPDFATDEDEEE